MKLGEYYIELEGKLYQIKPTKSPGIWKVIFPESNARKISGLAKPTPRTKRSQQGKSSSHSRAK